MSQGTEIVASTYQQDQYWIDGGGTKRQLDDMTQDHLSNVLSYSMDRAEYLYALDKGERSVLGRGVDDAGFGYFAEAYDWLESTPLIQAIKAKLTQS